MNPLLTIRTIRHQFYRWLSEKVLFLTVILCCLLLETSCIAQQSRFIPIQPLSDSTQFIEVMSQIEDQKDALYVFDIDNTLLITNENKFGSDWWYEQTTKDPELKLGISSTCLFDVLTPLFYASFSTTPVFATQPQWVDSLGKGKSKTIGLTSRGYTMSVARSTEIELAKNHFSFLERDSVTLAKDVVLLNSVIYTKGQNKGEILLDYVKNNPYQHIYYFDDSESKVKAVQKSFTGQGIAIDIYHLLIAEKTPYDAEEIEYMKQKLYNLVQTLNQQSETSCHCKKPE